MVPSSPIVALVRAILFELTNDAGEVVGNFGASTDVVGGAGYGLLFHYTPVAGWGSDDTAGVKWNENLGVGSEARFMWIDGPSSRFDAFGRPFSVMFVSGAGVASLDEWLFRFDGVGNPVAVFFGGSEDELAGVISDRTILAANEYSTQVRLRAGQRVQIALYDETVAGASSATLTRDGVTAEDLATSLPETVITPTVNWTVDAQGGIVKVGRIVTVQHTIRNATGGAVATPAALGTIPAGYRPADGAVFAAGYSSLGASRIDISTAGVVSCGLPAGNIPNAGYVGFSVSYAVPGP